MLFRSLVEFRGRLVETKRGALDRLVEEGYQADAGMLDFERAGDRAERVLSAMNRVFVERDLLLTTQGAMVPYYWLVRSLRSDALRHVRPFLLSFVSAVAENRKRANDPSSVGTVDSVLTRYSTLSRSINDPGSLEGRYEILSSAFKEWVTNS